MTERTPVIEDWEKFASELIRIFNDLDVLGQPLPNLSLCQNLQCLDTFVSRNSKESVIDFGEVRADRQTNLFADLPRLFRFELTLNLEIQRDLNDHNNSYCSGFVLNWTHQRDRYNSLTGGEASRDEI